jgi:hypothetical protein
MPSSPLFVIVFVAGIAVGYLLATLRRTRTIRLSSLPSGVDSGAGGKRRLIKTRTMELKCKCGALWKFRDPAEPGYEPFPSGDSFTCPGCGKIKDLREIHKLERKA